MQKLPKGVVQKMKAAVKKGKGKRKAKEESEEEKVEEEEEKGEESDGEGEKVTSDKVGYSPLTLPRQLLSPLQPQATSPYFDKRIKLDDRAIAEGPPLSPSFKLPIDLSPTKPRASTRASRSRAV